MELGSVPGLGLAWGLELVRATAPALAQGWELAWGEESETAPRSGS